VAARWSALIWAMRLCRQLQHDEVGILVAASSSCVEQLVASASPSPMPTSTSRTS